MLIVSTIIIISNNNDLLKKQINCDWSITYNFRVT